jgi:hypothetical protein
VNPATRPASAAHFHERDRIDNRQATAKARYIDSA